MSGKVPDPARNLFRDLRDRGLLPVVIVLVVAIVAIPIVLGTDPQPATPASAELSSADAAAGVEGAEIADPVVLAEVPGIRNFRKRLHSFQKSNPFRQQLTGVPKAVADAQSKAEKDATKAIDDVSGSGSSGSGTGSGSGASDTSATGDTGTSTDTGSSKTTTKTYGYFWKIDAKVGAVGEQRKRTGIGELEFLPGKSHPVVQFIQGIGESSAVFVVSRSVGDTEGDGKCRPHPNNCQFLALDVGEEQKLTYEPDGRTYRIKLTGVHLERKRINPDKVDSITGGGLDSFLSGD